MRNLAILAAATALSACGGGGPLSVSGQVPSAVTPTNPSTNTDVYTQFANPTTPRTYQGIGGTQVLQYNTDSRTATNGGTGLIGDRGQQGLTYGGYSSTVRNSAINLTYDPRDATFTLQVTGVNANATQTKFQDPASRTDFAGSRQPQWGTQNIAAIAGVGANGNYNYLQAGDGDPRSLYQNSGSGFVFPGDNNTPASTAPGASAAYQAVNLFFERPDSPGGTRYVSLAGFVRNSLTFNPVTIGTTAYDQTIWHLERGAFAYGIQTGNSAVPTTGSGAYTGSMLATMIYNPTLDTGTSYPNYFQWLSGTSTTNVNFATGAVTLRVDGIVGRPFFDYNTTPQLVTVAEGTSFTASGTATIDLVRTGGFTGQFQSARFGATTNGANPVINIAGSTIDGAFFGPAAEEAGGGFRIVGGNPDERIDIVGAFKGKK